jgi:hypothetical protein
MNIREPVELGGSYRQPRIATRMQIADYSHEDTLRRIMISVRTIAFAPSALRYS